MVRFTLRLPEDVHGALEYEARLAHRSLHAEILVRLMESLEGTPKRVLTKREVPAGPEPDAPPAEIPEEPERGEARRLRPPLGWQPARGRGRPAPGAVPMSPPPGRSARLREGALVSRCRSCEAEIIWALTVNGRRIPLDAEPAERPTGLFKLIPGELEPLAVSAAADLVYISHFATCPNDDEHRKT